MIKIMYVNRDWVGLPEAARSLFRPPKSTTNHDKLVQTFFFICCCPSLI